MKAALFDANRNFVWEEAPDPVLRDDEVIIEIHAAGVNRADLMQRAGSYPPPPGWPEWPGLEVSGYIREMGPVAREKSTFRVGDAVCALLGGGGYAELVACRYDLVFPVPRGIELTEAAALPEACATAYVNLVTEGEAGAGDTVLIHAGGSGLASLAIPMAKSFGMRVITTVRSDEKAKAIEPLGADVVANIRRRSAASVLETERDAGHPVDVVLDCLGGEMLAECLPFVARGCHWIVIATLAGDISPISLRLLLIRGIRLIGSTLRNRPPDVKGEIIRRVTESVWPNIEAGAIRPTIHAVLPIREADKAHALLEQSQAIGKVVLAVR